MPGNCSVGFAHLITIRPTGHRRLGGGTGLCSLGEPAESATPVTGTGFDLREEPAGDRLRRPLALLPRPDRVDVHPRGTVPGPPGSTRATPAPASRRRADRGVGQEPSCRCGPSAACSPTLRSVGHRSPPQWPPGSSTPPRRRVRRPSRPVPRAVRPTSLSWPSCKVLRGGGDHQPLAPRPFLTRGHRSPPQWPPIALRDHQFP
jgi:hypothetical protein